MTHPDREFNRQRKNREKKTSRNSKLQSRTDVSVLSTLIEQPEEFLAYHDSHSTKKVASQLSNTRHSKHQYANYELPDPAECSPILRRSLDPYEDSNSFSS